MRLALLMVMCRRFDDTNVELQLKVTNDDPAGSPTYTDFAPFFVGDYKASGIQVSGDFDKHRRTSQSDRILFVCQD